VQTFRNHFLATPNGDCASEQSGITKVSWGPRFDLALSPFAQTFCLSAKYKSR